MNTLETALEAVMDLKGDYANFSDLVEKMDAPVIERLARLPAENQVEIVEQLLHYLDYHIDREIYNYMEDQGCDEIEGFIIDAEGDLK